MESVEQIKELTAGLNNLLLDAPQRALERSVTEGVASAVLPLTQTPPRRSQTCYTPPSSPGCSSSQGKRRQKRTDKEETPKGGRMIYSLDGSGQRSCSLYVSPKTLKLLQKKAIVYQISIVLSDANHKIWSPSRPHPSGKSPWCYSGSTTRSDRPTQHLREQQQGTHPTLRNVWEKYKNMRLTAVESFSPSISAEELVAREEWENEEAKRKGYRSANSGPFLPSRRKGARHESDPLFHASAPEDGTLRRSARLRSQERGAPIPPGKMVTFSGVDQENCPPQDVA